MNKIKDMKFIIQIALVVMVMCGIVYSQSQDSLLFKAYETKSNVHLDKFFENWRMEKTPIIDEEYAKLTDAEKDVYDIFYEFYTPKDLSKLKLNSFEYEYYKDVKYFVIESKIYYRVLVTDNYDSLFNLDSFWEDSEYFYNKDTNYKFDLFAEKTKYDSENLMHYTLFNNYAYKDSITDFRPRIKVNNSMILYLTENYNALISKFIDKYAIKVRIRGIDKPLYEETSSRMISRFLMPYIFIDRDESRAYWYINTCPEVSSIYFSKDRTVARISYSFPFHTSKAVYKKTNGKWQFVYDKKYMLF